MCVLGGQSTSENYDDEGGDDDIDELKVADRALSRTRMVFLLSCFVFVNLRSRGGGGSSSSSSELERNPGFLL